MTSSSPNCAPNRALRDQLNTPQRQDTKPPSRLTRLRRIGSLLFTRLGHPDEDEVMFAEFARAVGSVSLVRGRGAELIGVCAAGGGAA